MFYSNDNTNFFPLLDLTILQITKKEKRDISEFKERTYKEQREIEREQIQHRDTSVVFMFPLFFLSTPFYSLSSPHFTSLPDLNIFRRPFRNLARHIGWALIASNQSQSWLVCRLAGWLACRRFLRTRRRLILIIMRTSFSIEKIVIIIQIHFLRLLAFFSSLSLINSSKNICLR